MSVPEPPLIEESPSLSRRDATLQALDDCIALAESEQGVTLGAAVDRLGPAGFCFLGLLLAAPFLQPVSLGPLTMASGGVFMITGWQMARGRPRLVLPDRARSWHLRGKGWVGVLRLCRKLIVALSRFTRPRLCSWVDGPMGSRNVGLLILIGGALLAVPCANLPFNNTLPALMIFFAALAWLERDGLFAVFSLVWGALTLAYFVGAAWMIWWAGSGVFHWLRS